MRYQTGLRRVTRWRKRPWNEIVIRMDQDEYEITVALYDVIVQFLHKLNREGKGEVYLRTEIVKSKLEGKKDE